MERISKFELYSVSNKVLYFLNLSLLVEPICLSTQVNQERIFQKYKVKSTFDIKYDSMNKLPLYAYQYIQRLLVLGNDIWQLVAVIQQAVCWLIRRKARFHIPGQASKRNTKSISSAISSQQISGKNSEGIVN